MDVDPVDKLERLKAEYESDQAEVEAELTQLEQKRNELEHQRHKLRGLIEGVDGVLSSIKGDSGRPQAAAVVRPSMGHRLGPAPLQKDAPTTNGVPKGSTRRQLVLRVIPEFHGETFEASNVRGKLLQHGWEE